ncbi:MAG: prepilin-type N-terminal cleavage/methylation domain-containing protein [Kosmotogaceae bacterium]
MKIDKENKKGFSLIELMVVVVIISFLALGAVTFFSGGLRSWIRGDQQLKAQREARQAMELVGREIKHGQYLSDYNVSNPISITVNFPEVLNYDPDHQTTYSWSGNLGEPFMRDGTNIIIDNVHNLDFILYDGSGNQLSSTDFDETSQIKILMEIDVDGNARPDISLDTDAELRNYGLVTIGELE